MTPSCRTARRTASTNAVGGEIADPVSTLYRNVLTSLPPNYQLQPGDLLTVRYSALTLAPREFNAAVDPQGGVAVEGVGRHRRGRADGGPGGGRRCRSGCPGCTATWMFPSACASSGPSR